MKQRIIYIDNLKALAIFTVIIGHVFYFTWNQYSNSIWNHLIAAYNMPLFFFLSGMFAKEGMTIKQIGRKAKQLLIPTATIGGVYAFFKDGIHELLFGGSHFGYWFLPTLFIMFIFFYVRCQIVKVFFNNKSVKIILLLDLLYMLGVWGITKILAHYITENIYNLICLNQITNYVLFFWGGFLTWKNKEKISLVIKMKLDVVYALCFLIFGVAFYFCYYSGYETTGLFRKIMALFTIPLLLILFRRITFNNNIQKIFSYVGTHSLEIYVLQYFFLPTTYSLDNSVMGGVNCLALALLESVLVVILCVILIKVIDINKYLNLIFFGK
jgi:hypothetical protein